MAWTQVNSLFPPASLIHHGKQTVPESTGKQEKLTDEGEWAYTSGRTLKLKLEQNPTPVPSGAFAFTFGSTLIDGIKFSTFRKKGKYSGAAAKLKK